VEQEVDQCDPSNRPNDNRVGPQSRQQIQVR